jgi:hypothetical protein
MRKILAGMALMVTLTATGFANPEPDEVKVSKYMVDQLVSAFPDAESITWEKVGDYYMARFTNSMGSIMAYMDEDGELYKVSRYIECKNLPLTVQRSLNETYDLKNRDAKVLEVTRSSNSQTYYLISFEYQNRKYIIESDLTGNLNVVRKNKV